MNRLTIPQTKLNDQSRAFTSRAMQKISQYEKMIEIMDPIHVLKRGFSITMAKNHVVHSAGELEQGEIIQTILSDGSVTSIIKNIKKKPGE
jgi:exodeoxyribonuclease VII large subunit